MKKIKLLLLLFFYLFAQNSYSALGFSDYDLNKNIFSKTENYLAELGKETIDIQKNDFLVAIKEYENLTGFPILVGYLPLTKYLIFSSFEPLSFDEENMIFAKNNLLGVYLYVFKDWKNLKAMKINRETYEKQDRMEKIFDLTEIKEKIDQLKNLNLKN